MLLKWSVKRLICYAVLLNTKLRRVMQRSPDFSGKRLICYAVLLNTLLVPAKLTAGSSAVYQLDLFMNMARLAKGEWIFGYTGEADMKFRSKGERNVKGEINLEVFSPDLLSLQTGTSIAAVGLKKAYIKANFVLNEEKSHMLRWTLGKTRLSWGEGFVFNAGDILFGSFSPYLDFTETELRDETAWLTALNFQLSPFVFLELTALPPEVDLSSYFELSLPGTGAEEQAELLATLDLPGIENSSVGGRVYAELGKDRTVKLETGYLYSGQSRTAVPEVLDQPMHRIYFGLEGNKHFNWQLTSSASFPVNDIENQWDLTSRLWQISAGLSHIHSINSDSSISFRLETLWVPYGFWGNPTVVERVSSPERALGLLIYPEFTYSPMSSLMLFLRSVISPIDASAQVSVGADWNVYKGLNLMLFLNFNGGAGDRTFAWERGDAGLLQAGSTGFSSLIGMRYKF